MQYMSILLYTSINIRNILIYKTLYNYFYKLGPNLT